jgi:Flp pilus assembly protein TadB
VAQTRRKRRTKHRGNAAGVVESRGRTGRKPTAAEKSGKPRDLARERERQLDKRDRPPTWRGAFVKAMFATIFLLLVVVVLLKKSNQAIGVFPIVLGLYTVISYYTDRFIYDRRQRRKAKSGGGGKAAPR